MQGSGAATSFGIGDGVEVMLRCVRPRLQIRLLARPANFGSASGNLLTRSFQRLMGQRVQLKSWSLCRYENTERRAASVAEKGIKYIGMGVSGGEEGARNGEHLCRSIH